ncbi:DEAD/DEAH box helicase [Peribacillus simplex]|uniref:DEAD/DEAH box helicase family protein n=1 Tax=Peribacillus simplex TaxID=1478 RepID=A0AAW7I615_9BACI|nr:DEAD/DEAH box helicase family protein [Peribacillus simplex]MDM5450965.1 DEAD/DEAH box helicase family protein [Peribacillus simplex]
MKENIKDYFLVANPNILENEDNEKSLRKVQRQAFVNICNHFSLQKSSNHAVAILPTGSGKTGVMAIAPYGVAQGRVLIITPQLVIKDHVLDSLDPSSPNNFWLEHDVFENYEELPVVTEYDKDTLMSELEESNIVILNIHKLSTKNRNSLIDKVDKDFFDMIIIDEAHHSPAKTWQDTLSYFNKAKVLKVTGTPFRADRKEIEGEVIINYRLGKAMHDGIVKTLRNFVLKPEKVYLTIDNDLTQKYSIEEIEQMNLKDSDFISRSVAYSPDCNKHIVESSIEELEERRKQSNAPHKIIAVCCSIKHAEDVKKIYEEKEYKVVIVHSKLSKRDKKEALRRIESHQAEIVIHVAMLGEGYDHPFLSVAAIFRPYRSLAPYSQFIGRILRKISDPQSKLDNIGAVIAHRDLKLDKLWKEYQEEQDYCSVVEKVKQQEKAEKKLEKSLKKEQNNDVAGVEVGGELVSEGEFYEYTLAAKEYEAYEKEIAATAEKLKTIFPDRDEQQLKQLARSEKKPKSFNPLLNNPKKYREILRTEFSEKVQTDVPASLLAKFNLQKDGLELLEIPIKKQYSWVFINADNAAVIAKYLNALLNDKYGKRNEWTLGDYKRANEELGSFINHIIVLIKSIVKEG